MGAVKEQKARKPYKCGKCGKKIEVGEQYIKICKKFSAVRYRCLKCRPRPSELTSSDKLSSIYGACEDIEDNLSVESKEDLENLVESLEGAISEVERVADEYEEGADNIEEYFTSGTEQSEQMRENADMVREWQGSLEDAKDKTQELVDEWDGLNKDERQERLEDVISEVEGAKDEMPL